MKTVKIWDKKREQHSRSFSWLEEYIIPILFFSSLKIIDWPDNLMNVYSNSYIL